LPSIKKLLTLRRAQTSDAQENNLFFCKFCLASIALREARAGMFALADGKTEGKLIKLCVGCTGETSPTFFQFQYWGVIFSLWVGKAERLLEIMRSLLENSNYF